MRKKFMLLSMVVAVVTVALVSVASFALFVANADPQEQAITAGEVRIAVTDPGAWSEHFDGMAPGDTVTKTLTLMNTGNLPIDYVTQQTRSGDLFSGTTPLVANLTNGTGHLESGASAMVTVNVALGLTAGNSYQQKQGDLVLTFVAHQSDNLIPTDSTFTKTGFSAPWDIYKLYDNGVQVQLIDPYMVSFTEIWPNGVVRSYPATVGDTDPNFYFNTAPTRPHGTYTYRIVMNNGKVYTPTITY